MLGYHVCKDKSFKTSINTAINELLPIINPIDMCFQVFLAGPQRRQFNVNNDDISYFRSIEPTMIAHATYCDFPWGKSVLNNQFTIDQLTMCDRCQFKGLVVHLGKPDRYMVADTLQQMFTNKFDCILYLETPHVLPCNSHYDSIEGVTDLYRLIYEQVDNSTHKIGHMIDTAHLWSCGLNVSDSDVMYNWLDKLIDIDVLLPNNIGFHLNDSTKQFGSGIDEHAQLTKGNIWSQDDTTLKLIAMYTKENKTPVIMERSGKPAIDDVYLFNQIIQQLY